MPRVSLEAPTTLIGRLAGWYSRRTCQAQLDPALAMAHNPRVLATNAVFELGVARWRTLDARLRLLAVMAAAHRMGCSWCTDFGYWIAVSEGVDEQDVRDVPRWRESARFGELDRAVLAYAEAVSGEVGDVTDERVAFVLCDVFQVPAPEVAAVLGRSPAAVRQLASRGRRRAREHGPPQRDDAAHNRVADAFVAAVARGDVAGVVGVLAPDVQFVSDGGGLVPAALRPVLGADRVARLVLGLVARDPGLTTEPLVVNGRRGYLVTQQGGQRSVLQLEVAGGQVRRMWVTSNPVKLTGIPQRSVG